jgi:hypothetical protein
MVYNQSSTDAIHPMVSQGGGVYSRKDSVVNSVVVKNRKSSEKAADIEIGSVETDTLDERDLKKKQVCLTKG